MGVSINGVAVVERDVSKLKSDAKRHWTLVVLMWIFSMLIGISALVISLIALE